jgi:hypothetical protein
MVKELILPWNFLLLCVASIIEIVNVVAVWRLSGCLLSVQFLSVILAVLIIHWLYLYLSYFMCLSF